jgi:hypothetical protein
VKYRAEVDGKVEGVCAIDVEQDIGGNIDIRFLAMHVSRHTVLCREVAHHTSCRDVEENGSILGNVGNVELLDKECFGWCAIGHRRRDCSRLWLVGCDNWTFK